MHKDISKQTTNQQVKNTLSAILSKLSSLPIGNRPAVRISQIITRAAIRNGTPFAIHDSKLTVTMSGVSHTVNYDAIVWLIEAAITKYKAAKLPLCKDTQKAYYLQLMGTVAGYQIANKKAS